MSILSLSDVKSENQYVDLICMDPLYQLKNIIEYL